MVRSLALRFTGYIALMSMALVALSNPAAAQQQPTDLHYRTAITQVYGSTYPLTGDLDLQIFPDGTLRGYYHTSFYKLFIPVAGGRDGNYIWFDIGPSSVDLGLGAGPGGKLHIIATMNGDNSFRGQVYPETAAALSGLSMQQYSPTGVPALASSAPNTYDQYIFAATPKAATEATPQP